jgi:hypothetical protein
MQFEAAAQMQSTFEQAARENEARQASSGGQFVAIGAQWRTA